MRLPETLKTNFAMASAEDAQKNYDSSQRIRELLDLQSSQVRNLRELVDNINQIMASFKL